MWIPRTSGSSRPYEPAPFFPPGRDVPPGLETALFILEPLRPAHVALDYEAVMASRDQLRLWGGHDWPGDDFTLAANGADLAEHWREHQERAAFTYTVLDPARERCLGCVYIRPLAELRAHNAYLLSGVGGDEALLRFWVRTDELEGELEALLLLSLHEWMARDWPFARTLFETREANARQRERFRAAGLRPVLTLMLPQRGGAHLFFE